MVTTSSSAYEGLLEKNAQDTKSGAGQYFTPRPLIQAIVDVMAPQPGETVCDPACGTGGFLLAAHDYVVKHNPNLTKQQKTRLKEESFKGWELVQATARLCAMNLLLHGIGSQEEGEPVMCPTRWPRTPVSASTWCSPIRPSARRAAHRSDCRQHSPPRSTSADSPPRHR